MKRKPQIGDTVNLKTYNEENPKLTGVITDTKEHAPDERPPEEGFYTLIDSAGDFRVLHEDQFEVPYSKDLLDDIEEAIKPHRCDCVEYMRTNTKGLSESEILQSSSELSVHIDDCIDQTERMIKRLREVAIEKDVQQAALCEGVLESALKCGENLDWVVFSVALLGFSVNSNVIFNFVKHVAEIKNKNRMEQYEE